MRGPEAQHAQHGQKRSRHSRRKHLARVDGEAGGAEQMKGAGQGRVRGTHTRGRDAMEPTMPMGKHHGGSHREYMAEKKRKLQIQFERTASVAETEENAIFKGVSVHVNGYTEPSWEDIKDIMAVQGGRFENYYSRERVTHIVCTHLPESKIIQILNERKPAPVVVKPEWITESLKQGKRLPEEDFGLPRLQLQPGQTTLDGFRRPTPNDENHPNVDTGKDVAAKTSGVDESLKEALRVAEEARSSCAVLGGRPRSASHDPNFMDTYFKASRLHFIGTWKERIENLMVKVSQEQVIPPIRQDGHFTRAIIHVDMDCFFASVAMLKNPHARGKPLVVCHSNSNQGKAEVSSANYEARKFGVRANMFIGEAKKLCPQLIVMPYQFDLYQDVSEAVYLIMFRMFPGRVQPVSCDEAYIDATNLGDPISWASKVRSEIFSRTGCTASAGISCNMLLSKIATGRAKPNGQLFVSFEEGAAFLESMKVAELPGVGWSTRQKLTAMSIYTCADLMEVPKSVLQKEFGGKTGELLFNHCRGIDGRKVETQQARKSIGAEVNWGVRFNHEAEAIKFMEDLCGEIQKRLRHAKLKGRCVTLKLKRKQQGANEPFKFLGHGKCDNLSKSLTLASCIDDAKELMNSCLSLWQSMRFPANELRGVGISVTRLDNGQGMCASPYKNGSITRYLVEQAEAGALVEGEQPLPGNRGIGGWRNAPKENIQVTSKSNQPSKPEQSPGSKDVCRKMGSLGSPETLPPLSQVDKEVLHALPAEVKVELERAYRLRTNLQQPKGKPTRKSPPKPRKSPRAKPKSPSQTARLEIPTRAEDCMTFTQVDPTIFAELPKDIQREVKATYTHSRRVIRTRLFERNREEAVEGAEQGVQRGSPSESLLAQPWDSFKTELESRCEAIFELLSEGNVDEYTVHLDIFQKVMFDVCGQLVVGNLETLRLLLRWLLRKMVHDDAWKVAVDQIVRHAQHLVGSSYAGGTLRL